MYVSQKFYRYFFHKRTNILTSWIIKTFISRKEFYFDDNVYRPSRVTKF